MTSTLLEPDVQIGFMCKICPKSFSSNRNLHRHVKRNHASARLQCYYCKFDTKFKECMARHVLRHLEKKDFGRPRGAYVKCPLCEFGCVERERMIEHYVGEHGVVMKEQNFEFLNQAEFLEWKRVIEEEDVCQYTSRSKKNRGAVNIRYYRCFRDGTFQRKGKGIRNMKLKGSIKINGICPAQMKVEEVKSSGVVRVTFMRTHVGHSHELGLLNLNKSERAEIARKLSEGMSHEDIIIGIRGSMDSNIKRLHLITNKDIWNVQTSFGLDKVRSKRRSAKRTQENSDPLKPNEPPEQMAEPTERYETYIGNFPPEVVYVDRPKKYPIPEPNWDTQECNVNCMQTEVTVVNAAESEQHYFSAQRVPENAVTQTNYITNDNHIIDNITSNASPAGESSCDNDDPFIEDMMVPEMPQSRLPSQGSELEKKKAGIRTKLEEILFDLKCDEHADLLFNELLRVQSTIQALSRGGFGLGQG